jgi:hypothetical protein
MTFKNLRQLITNGQSWKFKVKVVRTWESINFASYELMSSDMILIDEHVCFSHYIFNIYRFQFS